MARNRVLCMVLVFMFLLCSGIAKAQKVCFSGGEYFCAYDTALQCPALVQWTLHAADIGKAKRSASWRFSPVRSVAGIHATHKDYTKSGYQRGHLCPAKDRSASMERMRLTFSVSNIAPQVASLNVGQWLKSENECRQLAGIYDSVGIVVVPLFLPSDTLFIGEHNLAVPHAFFKAVWSAKDSTILNAWFVWNK